MIRVHGECRTIPTHQGLNVHHDPHLETSPMSRVRRGNHYDCRSALECVGECKMTQECVGLRTNVHGSAQVPQQN